MSGSIITIRDDKKLQWDDDQAKLQSKLGDLVQYFQVDVDTADSGLPTMYIDAAVMAPYLLSVSSPDDVPDEIVDAAKTLIDFDEGYPTVDGVPVWERFDGEPIPYYKLFKAYREMKYTSLTRSIAKLAEACGMPGKHLTALSKVYHWQMRAKAYDIAKDQELALKKEKEVEKMLDIHKTTAGKLLEISMGYIEDHPEQLSPKVALDMVQLAIKAGRISVGLQGDKPGTGSGIGNGNGGITINNTMQQADQMLNTNVPATQGMEQKIKDKAKDTTHLAGILNVLNQSGAFAVAAGQEATNRKGSAEEEYDYTQPYGQELYTRDTDGSINSDATIWPGALRT